MIQVHELKKKYGPVQALDGVSMTLSEGMITGILGPNGCGKSTLIKSILGLVVPDSGVIEIEGQKIQGAWDYRREIGYMPQSADFPANLTIMELLDMLEDIRGEKGRRRKELTDLFELGPHLGKLFGTLSGGTKQKVAAVSAFMFEPKILVLDEPTVGLDPLAASRIKGLIEDAAKSGRTVVLVTHMVSEIEQLVSNLYFLLEGKEAFSGTLESIRNHGGSPQLEQAIVRLIQARRV